MVVLPMLNKLLVISTFTPDMGRDSKVFGTMSPEIIF